MRKEYVVALDRGVLDENTHFAFAPPSFDSVEAERAHRKRRLIGAYGICARFGYDHWVAGHITVRDPEHEDQFWANPLGVSWHEIQESDLLRAHGLRPGVVGYGTDDRAHEPGRVRVLRRPRGVRRLHRRGLRDRGGKPVRRRIGPSGCICSSGAAKPRC